jgi:DNA-binding PadR family transcriptional regulator
MMGKVMRDEREDISDLLPLREPTLFILLSLADGEKHGYAILKQVAEMSSGKVTLSTGTLYEALARLLDQSLIERVTEVTNGDAENSHPGRPRKAYRLTPKGGQVVEAEVARLQALIVAAQQRLRVATGG